MSIMYLVKILMKVKNILSIQDMLVKFLKLKEAHTKIWLMTDKSLWLKFNKFSENEDQ